MKILSKYNHYTVKLLHTLTGDERCPAVVNAVIRQGLPLLTGKYGIDVALGYQKPAHEQLLEEAVQKGLKIHSNFAFFFTNLRKTSLECSVA